MRIDELFGRAGIDYPQSMSDIDVKEIITDSREASDGALFICICGATQDGHEHIGEAIQKGTKVIVAEHVCDDGVGGAATIYVENTRRAAALLYNSWYKDPAKDMTLVAVTGTNGKTSVSYLLREIFEFAGYRCGLIGTLSSFSIGENIRVARGDSLANMTTPDPSELYRELAIMRDDGVDFVFIEATSHALAYSKLDALRFDTAIFTNLTQDHLDFHGDMERYFTSKSKLFDMCDRAVINIDDKWAGRLIDGAACRKIYTASTKSAADFSAADIESRGIDGSEYTLRSRMGEGVLKIRLIGGFFVSNSLLAAGVALLYGIPIELIGAALSSVEGIDGRMERVKTESGAAIFIDYAHTPDALERMLVTLKSAKGVLGRLILVFGCGGDRDRTKRSEMAHIASRIADVVIVTSDNSRSEAPEQIFADILRGIDKEKQYFVIEDRRAAIELAMRISKEGDVIALAGKGHERYEIDRTGRHPFDEREIVKEIYEKYRYINFEGGGTDEGQYRM